MALPFKKRAGIAVVDVHGAIGPKIKISAYERLFDSIAISKRYRALLLDIDSPGGTASGSEVLYYSLRRVAARKPVVAYVRGIGASGAYYMCCAANKVIALPSALVGSIGVIYLRPIMEQLLGKVGVEFSVFKEGRLKDMSGFWRSPTQEEEGKFQDLLTEIYEAFVLVVGRGRSMENAKVRELATGELFTANHGLDLGLVDELGGFHQAIEAAEKLAEVPRLRPRWVAPKRPFSERLMGRFGSGPGATALLADQVRHVLAGGIYYMDPSYLLSDYSSRLD